MAKVRVESFALSIDGYGAGANQDLEHPLGVNGPELMESFFNTRVWRQMHGLPDGETGIDNEIAERAFAGIGCTGGRESSPRARFRAPRRSRPPHQRDRRRCPGRTHDVHRFLRRQPQSTGDASATSAPRAGRPSSRVSPVPCLRALVTRARRIASTPLPHRPGPPSRP